MPEPGSTFASGADARYGYHLLNLLGSLKARSDVFDRVVVFDLGLTPHQRELADSVRGVEVREVPAFVPHWRQGFTWKPWVWTHLDTTETVFWLDAGATLLRSLAGALAQIEERGYFLVSQGRRLEELVPADYWELYGLPRSAGAREYVAAGIIGFRVGSGFYRRVVVPTYEDCLAGRSLGFSAAELDGLNRGLQATPEPVVRDCAHFRWDQSLLNIHLALALPDAFVNDLDEYAGWRSPRDHPRQVIWSHRRAGPLSYLPRVPYTRNGLRNRLFGLRYRVRWWLALHSKYVTRATYEWKLRKTWSSLRRRRAPR